MSEPIITRALLEHYLRATNNPMALDRTTAFLARGYSTAEIIHSWDGLSAARLGLCAAAEEMFAEASQWTPFDSEEPGDDGAEHEVLMAAGRRLLKMAGVDPKRWEEARHG